uniref:Uncharacterized protein n=1 Tax=Mycolicibacterium phage Alyssa1 TaxID=3240801 RepID=A0AB39U2D8_9CAUD
MANTEENRTVTTTALIDHVAGQHLEPEISDSSWYHAGRLTDPETGATSRFVYKSPLVHKGPKLSRIEAWLDGAEPLPTADGSLRTAVFLVDHEMMQGQGELTLWEP